MRCSRCGAILPVGAPQCGQCGAAALPQAAHAPAGIPVTRYVPSAYGPPVATMPQPPHEVPVETASQTRPVRRMAGYRPVMLPSPPRARARGRASRTLWLLALTALLALAVGLLAYARGLLPLRPGPSLFGQGRASPALASHVAMPSPTVACPLAAVDPAADGRLAHVQLATAVHDAAAHDYRPVDSISTVHAGTPAYLTFMIGTAQPGTVGIALCTAGGHIQGALEVTAGSAGRYGEFTLDMTPEDVGSGVATVTWNGAVVASLRFTVEQ
jgi:hypothetical protein